MTTLTMSMALATCGSAAFAAKKCNVVGTWTDTMYGYSFVMTTDKKGTAGANPECSDEASKIVTTDLSSSVWDFNIESKKCSVVITADFDFDAKSCTSASGTITIPNVGQLPDSITKSNAVRQTPHAAPSHLTDGLK